MSKLELNITSLSNYWKIDSDEFVKRDILDPTFKKDVPLFIDPMLLKSSKYEIFRVNARNSYEEFFKKLYMNIEAISTLDGQIKVKAEKDIKRKLTFKENKALCLGFSKYGTTGRGTGHYYASILYNSAYDLIIRGINNSNFFSVLFFLETGLGADYISDMTACIILPELATFTENIAKELNIDTFPYRIGDKKYMLPKHPCYNSYILILPNDILAPLPSDGTVKNTLTSFCNSNEDNDNIRARVNTDIGQILLQANEGKSTVTELKNAVKDYVFKDFDALDKLSKFIKNRNVKPYDFFKDVLGIRAVSELKCVFENVNYCLDLSKSKSEIIENVITDFVNFIENNNKILKSLCGKKEEGWQSAFFLYIDQIFTKYNIDINSEAELGRGPIDFKFSYGNNFKILVEMKLSTNSQYCRGLDNQLELYKKCNGKTHASYFIFINLDADNKKADKKKKKLLDRKKKLGLDTNLVFIDGLPKPSASKL